MRRKNMSPTTSDFATLKKENDSHTQQEYEDK